MQDLPRGGANYFFFGGGGLRGVDMRLLGGFRSMLARNFFFEWCNLVRFGAYFQKFLLSNRLRISFLYKNNYKL